MPFKDTKDGQTHHDPEAEKKGQEEEFNRRIGMLRQWLNEDRITDPNKMVTNEDIKYWLNL